MPRDIWISTVSSNLARVIDLRRLIGLGKGAGPSLATRWRKFFRWLRSFLPRAGGMPGFFFFCSSVGAAAAGVALGAAAGAVSPTGAAGDDLSPLSPLSALGVLG